MDYVVVGSGAIGGTVGARLARTGRDILFCDSDASHVAAMNESGLAIEGPVEAFAVPARAVLPADLPGVLEVVLLAVKAQHTEEAMRAVAPRLAPSGYVVSLQNGLNVPSIAAAVGAERVVAAFVNFSADWIAPGRIHYGGRGAFVIGEPSGGASERVEQLVADIADARATENVLGFLWAKQAYASMLVATAVSDLSIADALAEPRYRALYVALAREVLGAATARPEAFDGFDPDDLDGSIDRLIAFNRRSTKTHSGIYRDLAVRRRKTEVDAILGDIDGPLVRRTVELVHAIEEGRRVCERANLELLATYARCEREAPRLNAVITVLGAPERAARGPLLGVSVAVKDNIDVEGTVTTNASTAHTPPPAGRDAEVVGRLRKAAADVFCKTNLLEYGAGSVNPAFGMTYNPRDPTRTSGGSSSGSAAVVAAGVCDHALGTDTGGSIRIPAAYCGIVGLKPTYGLVPLDGVFPLSPTCDHVGTLTATVAGTALLLEALSGRPCRLHDVRGRRIGVLRRQLEDDVVESGVRDRVTAAVELLAELGFVVTDVDVPELELADEALGAIVLREAYETHRAILASEADRYGSGTRALLEAGSRVSDEAYRAGLADRELLRQGFARVLQGVDVLAGPTVAYPAPVEDPPFGTPQGAVEGRYTGPYNLAGLPAVSVPCGLAEGALPAGLQLAAADGADALLLSVAEAFERAQR